MKVPRLSFLMILFAKLLMGQDINTGSRFTALGNTGAALQDVWSLHSNPAGLASLNRPVAAVTYQKNFPGTGLSTEAAVVALPIKKQVFGLGVQSFGFSAYKEIRLSFAYSRKFGESVFTALDFNYHQLSISSYGSKGTFSVDAGFQYKPTRELTIGAHVSNLSNSSYDKAGGALIPVNLSLGSSYRFSEELLLSTTLVAGNNDQGADFRAGIEYCLLRELAFRAGIGVHPFNQYGGLGYMLKQLSVDLAVSNHLVLGYTPQISIAYVF